MLYSKLAATGGSVLMLAGAASGGAPELAEHVGAIVAGSGLCALIAGALAKWAVGELTKRMGMIPGLATEVAALTTLMGAVKAEIMEERRLRRRDRKILRRLLDARDKRREQADNATRERVNELAEQVARHGAQLEHRMGLA